MTFSENRCPLFRISSGPTEDEFIYVVHDNGEHRLRTGSFAGFPAGVVNAHHLLSGSMANASFIVVGSRMPGAETIHYPDDGIGPVKK